MQHSLSTPPPLIATLMRMFSVLAKERKSGAPPLLGIHFSFDVVERM